MNLQVHGYDFLQIHALILHQKKTGIDLGPKKNPFTGVFFRILHSEILSQLLNKALLAPDSPHLLRQARSSSTHQITLCCVRELCQVWDRETIGILVEVHHLLDV